MVRVFLTIDTEVWPADNSWPDMPLSSNRVGQRDLETFLLGEGHDSRNGVSYQLGILQRHGLKATYFVEPLFSFALGLAPLERLVSLVNSHSQEIGLHLHPEWLTDSRCKDLPAFAGPLLNEYSEDDQAIIIHTGLRRLAEAGHDKVRAFRAGSWGANLATLRALARNGLEIDSSLNARFVHSVPDLVSRDAHTQPFQLESVWEFPVTDFTAGPPKELRPLHVNACSLGEFTFVLDAAVKNAWPTVVIVLHSFEFQRGGRLGPDGTLPSRRLLMSRFEQLCRYLEENSHALETSFFSDVDLDAMRSHFPHRVRSGGIRTIRRYVEQAVSAIY